MLRTKGFYFNSAWTLLQQNKQNSWLGNIALSSSHILWSIFRWWNLKLKIFFCIFLMCVCTHTYTLTQIHRYTLNQSILKPNFSLQVLLLFFFSWLSHLSTTKVLYYREDPSCLLYSCGYVYAVNATTFVSMVQMILLCFCKTLICKE